MAASLDKHNSETTVIIEELVQESLHILLLGTTMIAWIWTAFALLFIKDQAGPSLAVLALVLLTSGVSYYLSSRSLSPAIGVYLLGLVGAVTILALVFSNPAMLFLYMQVVLVAAVLTNPWITWGAALTSVAVVWGIGRGVHGVPAVDIVTPTIFILLTALAAWLSSRRLFTALAWALTMTKEAQKNAEEARRRRAEVRRVLKSLDEAYVRLERANAFEQQLAIRKQPRLLLGRRVGGRRGEGGKARARQALRVAPTRLVGDHLHQSTGQESGYKLEAGRVRVVLGFVHDEWLRPD